MKPHEWNLLGLTEPFKLVEKVQNRDGLARAGLTQERKMGRMALLKDRGKVIADRFDLRITDLRVEDLGQNLELTLAGQLLVIEIIRVCDDGATAGSFNLVLYPSSHLATHCYAGTGPALNRVPHLKCTVQWKGCKREYL